MVVVTGWSLKMNLTSELSAEAISRTPPTQTVQCIMRMPCISYIKSFWERLGYRAFSQPSPFGVRILNIEVLKKRLEVLVSFAHIGAGKCTHRLGAPTVDITEQAPLDLVVN